MSFPPSLRPSGLWRGERVGVALLAACGLSLMAGEAPPMATPPEVAYHCRVLEEPLPNRVHILRADLTSGRIRPAVIVAPDPDDSGPAEAVLTSPLSLVRRETGVVASVNANPWDDVPDDTGRLDRRWQEGQAVNISGLAVSGGVLRSPAEAGYPALWGDAAGRWHFGSPGPSAQPTEAVAGFQFILRSGASVAPAGGPRHPRTAVGMDRDRGTLWLVVVDGRQPGYSVGMTLEELARLMLTLGCWEAVNLDGGGSSVMALANNEGHLQVVNSPSDRRWDQRPVVRPVPVVLALRRVE